MKIYVLKRLHLSKAASQFEWSSCPLPGIRGMWSPNTHIMISHLNNLALVKYSPLLQSVIFNYHLYNQPFGEALPKISVDLEFMNDHMFNFQWLTNWIWNDEGIVLAVQTVISLGSPFEIERKYFFKNYPNL